MLNNVNPVGISACPITSNLKSIQKYNSPEYGLITFKSVRSHKYKGNPPPHLVYINSSKILNKNDIGKVIFSSDKYTPKYFSIANSYGVSSLEPSEWIEEFERTQKILFPNQKLILSIYPSIASGNSIIQDIVKLCDYVSQTTAEIVEINLTCPNTNSQLIFQNLELSSHLIKITKEKLNKKLIFAKIGIFNNSLEMYKFIDLNNNLNGISSINSIPMQVKNTNNNITFGEDRPTAGVSGYIINKLSKTQAKKLVVIRNKIIRKSPLYIIGIGGISDLNDGYRYIEETKVDFAQFSSRLMLEFINDEKKIS